ncbi:MAG: DMT family transporter [Crocinitomicaceae bacterium]|nr:DMT family transporter [Crocinitomicaceae bacterium]MBK8927100.1 DMT family transporter [Crocinitomicaceae bacterium]
MKTDNRAWLILILLALVWGSSFILMKRSMYPVSDEMVLDPYQVGALRIVLAGTLMLPFAIKNFSFLTRKDFIYLAVVGVCGNLLPATLFTVAETVIDSSLAGMLNMGTSFFVVLIGIIFYKSNPTKYQYAGLILGATGLYLILHAQIRFEFSQVGYALLILLATLMYATSLTTIKFKLQHLAPMTITSLAFFIILWPALIAAFWFDAFSPVISHPDGIKAFGFLSILSVVGTAIAVFLFNKMVSISNPIFASGVTYLMPVVAILFGLLDGDDFKFVNILWILLIISGVWLLNNGPRKFAK